MKKFSAFALVTFTLTFLAACGSLSEPSASGSPQEVSSRTVELFKPDAEIVYETEDFSKDPMYDSTWEAFEADNQLTTQAELGPMPINVAVRTHTFSNGETYTYTVYNGLVINADILEGTVQQLTTAFDEYEEHLRSPDAITPQGAMAQPYCSSRFLFICWTRQGGPWPSRTLYVDPNSLNSFTPTQKSSITSALNNLDALTDVQVAYRTTGARVVFTNRNDGCYATLGYSSSQPQNLNLANNCFSIFGYGTITHELGHAIGLLHEHQRTDRDNFIVINTGNLTSKGRANMLPKQQDDYRTSYDYASVMHYPKTTIDTSFAIDTKKPILFVNGTYNGVVGGNTLTSRDIQAINQRY